MIIISIDWALRKSLYFYDGKEVKTTFNPNDIKGDILLLERGAPYSLIAQLADGNRECKILMVAGEETEKYRESKGIEKTDENDAKCILWLYGEKPELFVEIKQRNIIENKLRYYIKMFYSLSHSIVKISNESKALEREYISFNVYKENIEYLKNVKDRYKDEIQKWSLYLYCNDVGALKSIDGIGELNASIFPALVDVRNFKSFKKFQKFCGYSSTKESKTIKDVNKYNRIVKNLIGTSSMSIIMHKTEPYYGIFKVYKDKKLKELMIKNPKEKGMKGHADNLARRKVSQKLLKIIWKRLWNVVEDKNYVHDVFKVSISKQGCGNVINDKVKGMKMNDVNMKLEMNKKQNKLNGLL